MLEAPEELLEERRRRGLDLRDEVWDGVLHMVSPPSSEHQRLGSRLLLAVAPVAERRGLTALYETGVFDPVAGTRDYRVPDLVFARPEHISDRGIEGRAALVVEILSPGDESREKLPFYAAVGVEELWFVSPGDRLVEVYVARAGTFHAALPDDGGGVRSAARGITLSTVPGPALHLAGAGLDVSV